MLKGDMGLCLVLSWDSQARNLATVWKPQLPGGQTTCRGPKASSKWPAREWARLEVDPPASSCPSNTVWSRESCFINDWARGRLVLQQQTTGQGPL